MPDSAPTLDKLAITQLQGVGARLSARLAKLGIHSVQDMLFHLPLRYQDRTRLTPVGAVQANMNVVIEGEIRASDIVYGRRRSLVCRLQDNTGSITLRFFHFSSAQRQNLKAGNRLRCFGEARRGSSGIELYHPEYQFLDSAAPPPLAQHLTPVYPTSEGLTQQCLRKLADQALRLVNSARLRELLPASTATAPAISLEEALRFLHHPPQGTPVDLLARREHPAQQRLALEELLAHRLGLLQLRARNRSKSAPALAPAAELQQQLLRQLPFQLTAAQQRVAGEIAADLQQPHPMLRLIQGDVGSGKTLVAALAALQATANGYQAAIMAPTEILAEQHRNSFEQWLAPLGIKTAWLTGRLKGQAREAQLEMIGDGAAPVVIGTHALFQQDVAFHNLGLAIIDEQHRFGVHQRMALKNKRHGGDYTPHQLIMTATPIPRTLAMSAYADLDCSVIDELPPGRTPVNTVVISNQRRQEIIRRVHHACSQGQQVYWVCTLIEESDLLEAQAAEAIANELHLALPGLAIGLVHGRLKPSEKEQAMSAFKAGDAQLLVATTVIEVGVDVPNATLMVIENPERLGLAQLHQLRGRVGRGAKESHCVLLYGTPLSRQASERLKIMRQTSDGFVIAEKDLELRGPGEVLGTRQTGELQLRIADLQRDGHLLALVKNTADKLLQDHPQNVPLLINRWLGNRLIYANT